MLTSRAREAGWARRSLLRALGREGWTRVQAGAWIEPGRDADFATRLRAVQLLKPRLVVSHRSATALWRIETLTPSTEGTLEFIDPDLTLRGGGQGVLVHRMPLDEGDVVRREGLRVTSADRTLADLLRAGPRDEALVAVESALTWRRVGGVRRAPVTTAALVSLALEAPVRGAESGRRRLKLADPNSGSPSETAAPTPARRRSSPREPGRTPYARRPPPLPGLPVPGGRAGRRDRGVRVPRLTRVAPPGCRPLQPGPPVPGGASPPPLHRRGCLPPSRDDDRRGPRRPLPAPRARARP